MKAQIVERLREDGHAVQFVAELNPGIDDEDVLIRSRQANAILLTADKDFGELVFRQRLLHSGIVLFRLSGMEPGRKADLISWMFGQPARELRGGFAVLSPRGVRIRHAP